MFRLIRVLYHAIRAHHSRLVPIAHHSCRASSVFAHVLAAWHKARDASAVLQACRVNLVHVPRGCRVLDHGHLGRDAEAR